MMSPAPTQGRIAENILYFARLLRSAGLPLGTGQVLEAINATRLIGIESRSDLYWCLFSQFVTRQSQRQLYDQAFHIFWRNPHIREKMLGALLPKIEGGRSDEETELARLSRRLQEALVSDSSRQAEKQSRLEVDASFTSSRREVLQNKDFEQMSAEEIAEAKRLLATFRLPIRKVPTRRFRRSPHPARVDMRATLRAALRGSDVIPLQFKRPRRRHPPLVVLVDISGSMSRYSRMFLHFIHAVTNDRDRVYSFVFGTRLTNISRHLRHRDVDLALERTAAAVKDWSGGTRIGHCLEQFNRIWLRRVLGQGAVVLLISDGLDRDEGAHLEKQMERLQKSCRQLIWLNPLLRYSEFEPRACGIRAMLPHVDEFRAAHNLTSLSDLAEVIGRTTCSE